MQHEKSDYFWGISQFTLVIVVGLLSIGKRPGKVTITAETTDGSNLKATAEVTVKEAEVEGNKGILKFELYPGYRTLIKKCPVSGVFVFQ